MKKEWIILAVVILLGGAYLLFKPSGRIRYKTPEWKSWTSEEVQSLEYEGIRLQKQQDSWMVGDPARLADQRKVDSILTALENLMVLDMVSQAEHYEPYDLQDQKAHHFQLQGEERSLELWYGKKASTGGGTYARFPDRPEVFIIRGDWNHLLPGKVNDLRDKTVLTFDPESVKEVQVHIGDRSITLKKNGEDWFDGQGMFTSSADWKDHLIILSRLMCKEYSTPSFIGNSVLEIETETEWLKVYNFGEEGSYLAESSQSSDSFVLEASQVDPILNLFP